MGGEAGRGESSSSPAHTGFKDLNTAIRFGSTSLIPPGRMELANLGVQKHVNISQEKLCSREVQVKKK